MNFIKTAIDGVVEIEPRIFGDDRGYFFEAYNRAEFVKNGIDAVFVQDNQSGSSYGVVRGLHMQKGEHSQAKLLRVIEGEVLDVAVDVRDGSPTFGHTVVVKLNSVRGNMLYIPRGFLHGFSVLSERAVFTYKCDNLYNRDAETGVRFDDAKLNIDWQIPADKIIVSEKDKLWGGIDDVARYRG